MGRRLLALLLLGARALPALLALQLAPLAPLFRLPADWLEHLEVGFHLRHMANPQYLQ
jgi:hypothetical protein